MSLIEKILSDPMHTRLSKNLSDKQREYLDNSIREMLQGAELLYEQVRDITSTETGRLEMAEIFEEVIKQAGVENVDEK